MVEKFGSDQSQLATFGGGVISEDGAVLLSGESTGSTASLAGPALVREQQTMIANGDWTIPPADPYATITADNPLPYWTFVDNTGNGKVTCALVFDANAGSQKRLRWNVAITAGSSSASISRFVYIPASGQRAFAYVPELYVSGQSSGSNSTITLAYQYYKLDQTTTTGTGDSVSATINTMSGKTLGFSANATRFSAPSDAAFMLITITVAGTTSAGFSQQVDVAEVRLLGGPESFLVAESNDASTYAPARITQTDGNLIIQPSYTTGTAGGFSLPNSTLGQYDKQGSADTTTITTAGTYYALTNAEVTFTPQFVGQRWLLCYSGYASLNTTVIQYCFVRANVTDTSNVVLDTLGFGRADNFGTSGRGATVAVTKVWVADTTSARKFKLYGTVQTTNGLTLSLAYTQMTAYPIG